MAATDDILAGAAIGANVAAFYEGHPYPPPVDDLKGYSQKWDNARRRADAFLFWPNQPYREDRSILIAGCGTSQAAKYALRWPKAQVTGIDFSAASIDETAKLKRKHSIHNLELRQLPIEQAGELGRSFDHVVCTGVIHHLAEPDIGLRALGDLLAPDGAMHLMVYAPYGRTGIYMLQDYCRRLGIGTTAAEIRDLAASLRTLPPDHPLTPLLRNAHDFATEAGLADALLNPQDRAYSVPDLFEFLARAKLAFGRWLRQAPYLPHCGIMVQSPHRARLARLPAAEQYAALELFRGCMVQHSLVAYRADVSSSQSVDFDSDDWLDYIPIRLPDTIIVEERLPPRAVAVLINRSHSFTDLYLPIDGDEKILFDAIDGRRSIGEIAPDEPLRSTARILFERLWRYDQVVFDLSAKTNMDSRREECNR
jgi:SAM-dependent methyltransferase